MNIFSSFPKILINFQNSCFFRTPLSNCVFIMFINFYFCCNIDFFLVSSCCFFFSLKRQYIGFFENAIVYSCMQSSSVNMFFSNWRVYPILIKQVFLEREVPHSERLRISLHPTPQKVNKYTDK